MNATIIGQPGCQNCAHHGVQNRQMVCMLNPPQAMAIVAYVGTCDLGKVALEPQPRGFMAAFPSVMPDWKCGQHKTAVLRAREPVTIDNFDTRLRR
jgi:hypothetical protein